MPKQIAYKSLSGQLMICHLCKSFAPQLTVAMVGSVDLFGKLERKEYCAACLEMQQRHAERKIGHCVEIVGKIEAMEG